MGTAVFPSLLLIPVLPLTGAVILAFFGARMSRRTVHTTALGSVLGAFVITVLATWMHQRVGAPLEATFWTWMAVGRYSIDLSLGFDGLTTSLLLVVTGVGFLIHVYSTEYMGHDRGFWRYFAYLNFFIFAMSILVLGRSLPVMFIGWEGVGLASYLLIGFWFTDIDKARAGKKAFITNRVGDFGFLIGTFVIYSLLGTGDFLELSALAENLTGERVLKSGIFSGWTVEGVLTFGCLMLFLGACGKSAQFPLYIWLPDAMAGPTPVSALIHAATMVTAGVYMVCRMGALFDLAPVSGEVVAWVGGFTALFAATMGLAQNDIKKVLAYSTVSQLGYMFIAAGLGAYSAAMFHVVTHAFFKACLFLGSGAVIHALHEEQDIRRMGGLSSRLPVIYLTFLISTLALSGIPPLSGFFSKDAILAYAFHHSFYLWLLGFFGAGLTALYMFRLVALTFFGELRAHDSQGNEVHLHPPGWAMKGPLVVLAALAVVGGMLNLPHILEAMSDSFHSAVGWLDHYLEPAVHSRHLEVAIGEEIILILASVAIAVLGIGAGTTLYRRGPSLVMERVTRTGPGRWAYIVVAAKYYVDEIVHLVIVRPLNAFSQFMAYLIDPWVIDGVLARLSSTLVSGSGKVLSRIQTGNVQSYAVVIVVAIAVFILWTVG
ncbi:MAG: NADH-quinone oxidoreductase subunit L [Myxococcota bacterium]